MNQPSPFPAPTENRLLQLELARHAKAGKALAVLAENNEADSPPEEDVPPVPDHLRSRWQEAYAPRPAVPAGAPRESLLAHFGQALRHLLEPRQLALAGGVAVAVLALTLFLTRPGGGESGAGTGTEGVVVRGGKSVTAPADYLLLLVPPAAGGTEFVREFNLNWSKPVAEIIPSAAAVQEMVSRPGFNHAVVLADLPSGEVSLWKNGAVAQRWPLSGSSAEELLDSAVSQIESAARTLNPPR